MVKFTTTILQFAQQGEKTGWTYISIPQDIALQLKPNNKKGFRVNGKLDNFSISSIALLPMGDGSFIMALNSTIRKGIGKRKGAMLTVQLIEDKIGYQLNAEFIACLQDEPTAYNYFKSQSNSMQNYFSKWIESAKTQPTKEKRIAMAVTALYNKMDYAQMLRAEKSKKEYT